MKTLTLLSLLIATLSGCVRITYKQTNGATTTETTYSSPAFGSKSLKKADFSKGIIEGAQSEQSSMTDVLGGVYQAGVAMGKAAVKP